MASRSLTFDIGLPQRFFSEDIDATVLPPFLAKVEELGYGGVWVREQAANARYDLAPIPLLSYAAALTTRVRLGTSVLLGSLRNPVHTAKSLATLDRLSNGRLTVGMGIGNRQSADLIGAFGVGPGERGRRLEECVRLMRDLWSGDPVTFEGEFFQTDELFISPLPVQRPHPPIWFGGHAPAALRRAAKLGDGWMEAGAVSTQTLKGEIGTLRDYVEAEGRDPDSFTLSKRVVIAVEDNRQDALRRLEEWHVAHGASAGRAAEVSVFGPPEDCIAGLNEVASAGLDMILVNPLYDYTAQAERLAADVLPRVVG